MSKQAQLPPRCPLQKKNTARLIFRSTSQPEEDIELHRGVHKKSLSQSSILEEHPKWLNNLLSDSNSNSTGIMHRPAASGSLALFDALDQISDVENPHDDTEPENGFESSCTYGPNSPRRKNKAAFPENEIVTAFSEYVVQNPVQHLDGHISLSGSPYSDSFDNGCASTGVTSNEANPMKRYVGGQRSRVRKLQYIAELEKTVQILQNVRSELSMRVASLHQQHMALSMENNTLNQQLLIMQQEKLIAEGEYLSLKKELELVKTGLAFAPNKKVHNWSYNSSDAVWDMPDIGTLCLK